MYIKAPDIFH